MTTKQKQCADALVKAVLDHPKIETVLTIDGLGRDVKAMTLRMIILEAYDAACKEPEPVEDWMGSAAQDLANYISPEGTDPEEFEQLVSILAKHAPRPDPQAVTHCDDCDPSFNDCWHDKGPCRKRPLNKAVTLEEIEAWLHKQDINLFYVYYSINGVRNAKKAILAERAKGAK